MRSPYTMQRLSCRSDGIVHADASCRLSKVYALWLFIGTTKPVSDAHTQHIKARLEPATCAVHRSKGSAGRATRDCSRCPWTTYWASKPPPALSTVRCASHRLCMIWISCQRRAVTCCCLVTSPIHLRALVHSSVMPLSLRQDIQPIIMFRFGDGIMQLRIQFYIVVRSKAGEAARRYQLPRKD
jgi:hypothetical protein